MTSRSLQTDRIIAIINIARFPDLFKSSQALVTDLQHFSFRRSIFSFQDTVRLSAYIIIARTFHFVQHNGFSLFLILHLKKAKA